MPYPKPPECSPLACPLEWGRAYVTGAWAYTDSETKRAETADCLDSQAKVK